MPPFVTLTQPLTLISRNSPRCKLIVRMLLSDTAEPQKARFKHWRRDKERAITSTLVSESAQQKLYQLGEIFIDIPNQVAADSEPN